jgi:DNA-binding CsgD family transcriptional regulator
MTLLSQKEYTALLSALEKIYSISNLEDFPSGVLSVVRQLFPCNTICYNEITLPNSMTVWITEPANAVPNPILKEAFMLHFTEHPALTQYAQSGDGRSYRISDFISHRKFHNLTLYNEYYRHLNVEYQMLTGIFLAPGQMVGLAFDRDCSDFLESEKLCLDLLRPHLVQTYRNVQTLDLMKQAAEQVGNQVMVVGRSGQTCLDNDNTWRTIARYFDIKPSSKYLPEKLYRWIEYERARFCQASEAPTPSVPLVVTNEKGQLTLKFVWGGKVAGQDLLLLKEEPASPYPALTQREAEILTWLSQGKTNVEIGEALSISPHTVKKHLEHIYSKLQVHRRTGAVTRSLRF